MNGKNCWSIQRIGGLNPLVYTTEAKEAALAVLETMINTTLREGPVPASINLHWLDQAGAETLIAHMEILQTMTS